MTIKKTHSSVRENCDCKNTGVKKMLKQKYVRKMDKFCTLVQKFEVENKGKQNQKKDFNEFRPNVL